MTMLLPPVVFDVRVREAGSPGFRIWFPFFLLWPLLLLIVGVALIVTIVVDAARIASGARYHHYTRLLLATMRLLAETRGTHARVFSDDSRVNVDIY